jgi:hypothetical protein
VTKPNLKVLFASGYAEPLLAQRGQQKAAWLKKPYTANDLAEKIREVMCEREPNAWSAGSFALAHRLRLRPST